MAADGPYYKPKYKVNTQHCKDSRFVCPAWVSCPLIKQKKTFPQLANYGSYVPSTKQKIRRKRNFF